MQLLSCWTFPTFRKPAGLSSHSSRLAILPFSSQCSLYFTYFFTQVHFNVILPYIPNSLECPLLFWFCCQTIFAFFIATYFARIFYVYLITFTNSSEWKMCKVLSSIYLLLIVYTSLQNINISLLSKSLSLLNLGWEMKFHVYEIPEIKCSLFFLILIVIRSLSLA
jgi:hypothetical protein